MSLKLTNIDKPTPLNPKTAAHAHACFLGALRVYGHDSREAEIAYTRWQKHEESPRSWSPDEWQQKAQSMRQSGTSR